MIAVDVIGKAALNAFGLSTLLRNAIEKVERNTYVVHAAREPVLKILVNIFCKAALGHFKCDRKRRHNFKNKENSRRRRNEFIIEISLREDSTSMETGHPINIDIDLSQTDSNGHDILIFEMDEILPVNTESSRRSPSPTSEQAHLNSEPSPNSNVSTCSQSEMINNQQIAANDKNSNATKNSLSSGEYSPGFCPICRESMINRQLTCTRCGHIYCEICIVRQLERNCKCPVCNAIALLEELRRLYF
uniref:RING-type domain-containing protein n=1 Tax=Glossina brevipalpis TaxID=37001 RepID=A0A1A9WMT5_9MUSC